ncbi:MAG TPA: ATP-dependent DNA helicase RecQ [Thermoleophilaceae bacterium]|jgi:ATP-dependent DNA helicase RecQ|nr:ATP-dependent DNA helicase RecQ [Thermoleophilaceae bacterium]
MDLAASLHQHFGFRAFRPGQEAAVRAALDGRDALVVMPTGSGKSLCYQLPALMREDLTVVVSPLVALMQDQVDGLRARGAGDRVALVNAQQAGEDNRAAIKRAADGELRLLYVAPERFGAPGFLDRMAGVDIGLFVVDEAHCVSQWGHDFRPDYFRLEAVAKRLQARAVMASTATATARVAADIARRLDLRDPVKVTTGFDRPNLTFSVARPNGADKRAMLIETLSRDDALPAIVYAGTRAGCEELADFIGGELGVAAEPYHAGLDRERRAAVQRRFLADQTPVIVATNAFGMGVDKPNVRTVVHASTPPSLEAYYQEAGRAGRDGLPGKAVLLAEPRDKALHVHFIRQEQLDDRLPRDVAGRLSWAADGDGFFNEDAFELAGAAGCDGERLRSVLGHLTRAGVLAPSPAPSNRVAGRLAGQYDGPAAARCRSSMEEGIRVRWRQYREIWAYAEADACRRTAILRHFGDPSNPQVENCCDICAPSLKPVAPPPPPEVLESLDDAIFSVVRSARPNVGRTACVEILHGAQSKKVKENSYDGLSAYAMASHMRRTDILARVDHLLEAGRLASTGGKFPKLKVVPQPAAAAA